MALSIDVGANTRAAVRGMKDLEQALEDNGDALDDLARNGDKAGDKIEKSFRDQVREAGKAERATKDVGDAGRQAGRDVERGMKDAAASTGKVGDEAREVGDELKQNLGETFSSFRGDLEDLPQIAQDTLGGLAGSGALGGIPGLVATAAGAAGIGLLIGAFDQAGEAQEQLEEKAREWADSYIEAGSRVLSATALVEKGRQVLTERYDEVTRKAKEWGVAEETAAAALAGSPTAIAAVTDAVSGLEGKYRDMAAAEDPFDEFGNANGPLLLAERAWRTAKGSLDEVTGAMDLGAKRADVYSFFLRDVAAHTEGATSAVDELGDTIVTLPDGKQIYIDAETGQATDNADAIEQKIYGLPDKTVRIGADTGAAARGVDDVNRRSVDEKTVRIGVDDSALRNYRPAPLPELVQKIRPQVIKNDVNFKWE